MVYLSTNCLPELGFFETLDQLRKNGIRQFEFSYGGSDVDGLDETVHLDRERYLVHNYFPPPEDPFILNLASPDEDIGRRSVNVAEEAIDLCNLVGASVYTIHGGFVADPSLSLKFRIEDIRQTKEEARERFLRRLDRVLAYANDRGVSVAIENNVVAEHHRLEGRNPFFLFADEADFQWLMESVSSDDIGVLLDLGHLKVSSNVLDFDPRSTIEALEDDLLAVHLHDNDGRQDRHQPVSSDDYYAFPFLQRIFGSAPIILEGHYRSPEQASRNRTWLENRLVT